MNGSPRAYLLVKNNARLLIDTGEVSWLVGE